MKMCQPHWDALKTAIKTRDLFKYVASNAEIALTKMQAQLQPGTTEQERFDPLMNANMAIFNNALESGGLYLLDVDEHGNEYCPLCEYERHTTSTASVWINCAVEEQLEIARNLGYMPKALTN